MHSHDTPGVVFLTWGSELRKGGNKTSHFFLMWSIGKFRSSASLLQNNKNSPMYSFKSLILLTCIFFLIDFPGILISFCWYQINYKSNNYLNIITNLIDVLIVICYASQSKKFHLFRDVIIGNLLGRCSAITAIDRGGVPARTQDLDFHRLVRRTTLFGQHLRQVRDTHDLFW